MHRKIFSRSTGGCWKNALKKAKFDDFREMMRLKLHGKVCRNGWKIRLERRGRGGYFRKWRSVFREWNGWCVKMKWGCVVVVLDWATNSFLVYLIYSRFYSRLSFIQFKRGHVNLVEWNRRHDEMALAQRVGKNFTKRIIFILSPNLLPNYSPSHNFNRKISNQHSLNVFWPPIWPPIWLPVITLIVAFIIGFTVAVAVAEFSSVTELFPKWK